MLPHLDRNLHKSKVTLSGQKTSVTLVFPFSKTVPGFCVSQVLSSILTYNQQTDLFGDSNFKDSIKKKIFIELKGVENVFTRHTPLLKGVLEDLIKDRLREQAYPCINGSISFGPQSRRFVLSL